MELDGNSLQNVWTGTGTTLQNLVLHFVPARKNSKILKFRQSLTGNVAVTTEHETNTLDDPRSGVMADR